LVAPVFTYLDDAFRTGCGRLSAVQDREEPLRPRQATGPRGRAWRPVPRIVWT
jgi:hypothetical protein